MWAALPVDPVLMATTAVSLVVMLTPKLLLGLGKLLADSVDFIRGER